ncbi:uncharacterized protein HMPREF1541_08589 [Cyphellophora europaea CBS 101466]|uniref:AAA+ ATPase domain-containing protein n=1 Tax=Cyphellophora europaea (strain CBS 101466) TaxID=1220924 RepID=W2RII2_CYPE1|nr:uncharacterized protein HMPREF1541_08589 [Cyphellophora europaea CBS 101466]ETN36312.1 hypothetical protein HMPREF1541_08589 [Cyphellophora europaea CBS 101466]
MPGPPVPSATNTSTSLAITNPLVLYRTLVATNRIKADPAQHRLALQLQKLYFRLKDYRPEIDYRRRLQRVTRGLTSSPSSSFASANSHPTSSHGAKSGSPSSSSSSPPKKSLLSSLFEFGPRATADMKALTRSTPLHDTALAIDSPQGLLLYGGVGRGKSMLLDLLFASLPTAGKRRWHFNTFMLDVFRRLEVERLARMRSAGGDGRGVEHEHVVLSLARETVETSPVLFLDEFQMPDRASSRLVNGFLTGFFGLGGVLVASSNRMPEELSKGQGVRFSDPYWGGRQGRWGRGGWVGWFGKGQSGGRPPDEAERFVEVLKARCELWEMEGERDWRREETEENAEADAAAFDGETGPADNTGEPGVTLSTSPSSSPPVEPASSDVPPHYHLTGPSLPSSSLTHDITTLNPTQHWSPLNLTIYGRTLTLPQTYHASATTLHPAANAKSEGGVLNATFANLCTRHLGPADYVSLCARFHSIILTSIPVLTATTKNEARRLIWLIDAMYEAGVRLVVSAEAPVDRLFFPEVRRRSGGSSQGGEDGRITGPAVAVGHSDSIESEAMSEMYQDSTAPFRPNVASYDGAGGGARNEWRSADPTFVPGGREARNMLADEDADFGPTYGNGRGHGPSASQEGMREVLRRQGMDGGGGGGGGLSVGMAPDFTDTRVLVGEDEKFAYRRARSRLWEMCGRRWWRVREGRPVAEWWRPEGGAGRFWEGIKDEDVEKVVNEVEKGMEGTHDGGRRRVDAMRDAEGDLFKHGASPYRTSEEAPPKFGWQHAWGMMRWGKKAGDWGKGVEGTRGKGANE